MINGIKKLSYIALKNKTRLSIVFALLAQHMSQSFHSFVISFTKTTGKRIMNIGRFKYRTQNLKHSMVENPIPDSGFVNMAKFWIVNIKTGITAVLICFIAKIPMQLKNILFKVFLKTENIQLLSFTLLKFIPG